MPSQPPSRSRIASLDTLKVLAIFAVVAIHIPPNAPSGSISWQIVLQLCRFAVPVFFLISGYLFKRSWDASLDRNAFLRRIVGRLATIFIFWAIFYALVPPFITGSPEGVPAAIRGHFLAMEQHPRNFLLTGFAYHLWFLSALIQAFVILWLCLRNNSPGCAVGIGGVLYFVALAFGPYAPFFIDHRILNDPKNGPFLSTIFVALGALIADRRFTLRLGPSFFLALAGALLCFAEAGFLSFIHALPWKNCEFSIGSLPLAAGIVFMALSRPAFGSRLAPLGIYSLGIYAIHPYIIELCSLSPVGPSLEKIPLVFAMLAFTFSVGASIGLSRVTILRRLVT